MNDLTWPDGCKSRGSPGVSLWKPVVLTLLVIGILPGATAWAHKMVVFATVQGKAIHGEVHYQDGSPAQRVTISVLGPADAALGTATTDAEGKFIYQPQTRCPHTFVADGGFGHRAEYTVPAEELPPQLPVSPAAAAPSKVSPPPATSPGPTGEFTDRSGGGLAGEIRALNQQIVALREDLGKWKAALRLQDVLGGVGYILGILGVFSYFLAGRRREQAARKEA